MLRLTRKEAVMLVILVVLVILFICFKPKKNIIDCMQNNSKDKSQVKAALFKDEIKELKKKYVNKIKKNQEQIEKILKLYLQDINDFLLKKEYIKKVKIYQSGR